MFSAETVTAATDLSPLQQRSLFRTLGFREPPAPPVQLMERECRAVWTFMLLNRLKFLSPDQRSLLFEELVTGDHACLAAQKPGHRRRVLTLAIADGRYATWTGREDWLDLHTGKAVTAPADPPLETVAYHLHVLFDRNASACRERQGSANAQA